MKTLILTDLEPDDIIALRCFTPEQIGTDVTVIVGEGSQKDVIVKEYIVEKYFSNFKVLRGSLGKKDYPSDSICEQLSIKLPDNIDNIYNSIKGIFGTKFDKVIVMKPPRELLENLDKFDFSDTDMWLYGSFNIRTLKLEASVVKQFIDKFKCVYWIESFHCLGQNNSFNVSQNCKDTLLKSVIKAWNKTIVKQCLTKINNNEDEASVARNKKILAAITDKEDTQFVCADILIPYTMKNNSSFEKSEFIDFDKYGYPIFERSDTSKLFTMAFSTSEMKIDMHRKLSDYIDKFV